MGYTKQEIINRLKEIEDISELYTNDMINYGGDTKDTKEKYTEVITQEILRDCKRYNFDNIKQIERKIGYKIVTHNGEFNKKSNRREEIIAMKMFRKNYKDLGEILDYQIPLKASKGTKAGKVDLISYKKAENTLYLIELKNDRSKESLLRCALEIITYSKQIDKEKLKTDFGLEKNTNIKLAILIFKDTKPYYDLDDKHVNKLINKFDIDVFVAEKAFSIEKRGNIAEKE